MNIFQNLPDTVVASIYNNAVAIILCVGVLAMFFYMKGGSNLEKKLIAYTEFLLIALSLSFVFETAAREKCFELPGIVMLIEGSVHDIIMNFICLFWLLIVNVRMYGSLTYISRKKGQYLGPIIVLFVLNLANMVFPVFLYYGEDHIIHFTTFRIVQDLVRYLYFLISVFLLYRHKQQGNTVRFFNISAFVIPVFIGAAVQNLTPYYIQSLPIGIATGLMLLFAEMANEQSFSDNETGFFNRSYLNYLAELMTKGTFALKSAMIFEVEDPGRMKEFSKLLKEQLPMDCEPVRVGKGKIIVFSSVAERAPLHMVTEDVQMSLDQFNEANPSAQIGAKMTSKLRKKKETGEQFLYNMIS